MLRFKAIIFDLDNTLLDFMELKKRACSAAMDAMIDAGLQINKQKGMRILFSLYDKYGIEDHIIFQRFLKKTQKTISYPILAAGIVAYRTVRQSYQTPYPHVHKTLTELRKTGYLLGVISDAPKMNAWMRIAALRLTQYFHKVITFDDTGQKKPSPAPFRKMLSSLDAQPAECLMVGDWVERDIKGASALGIKTCYARYGAVRKEKVNADYVIDDISELLRILNLDGKGTKNTKKIRI